MDLLDSEGEIAGGGGCQLEESVDSQNWHQPV
jgi:hypothetical protein